jgi:hypothetical protein
VDVLTDSTPAGAPVASRNSVFIKGDNTEIHGTIAGSMIRVEDSVVFDGAPYFQANYSDVWLQDAPKLSGASIYGGLVEFHDIDTVKVKDTTYGTVDDKWVPIATDIIPYTESYGEISNFNQNYLLVNDYTGQGKLANIGNFMYFAFNLNPENHLTVENAVLKTENLYLGSAPDSEGVITPSSVGFEYHDGYNQDYRATFGEGIQFSGATAPGLREGATIYLIAADHAWNYDGSEEAVEGTHFDSTTVKVQVGSLFEITRDFTTHLEDNNIVAKMNTGTELTSFPVNNSVGLTQIMAQDTQLKDFERTVTYSSQEGQQATGHGKWRNMTREQRREAFSKLPEAKQNEIKAKRAAWREAHPDGGRRHHRAH